MSKFVQIADNRILDVETIICVYRSGNEVHAFVNGLSDAFILRDQYAEVIWKYFQNKSYKPEQLLLPPL